MTWPAERRGGGGRIPGLWKGGLTALVCLPVALALPTAAVGQTTTQVRSSVLYESYEFGEGLGIDRVSESSLAVSATAAFGSRLSVTAASGFASVDVEGPDADAQVSGLLDTEVRLSWGLVPDRVLIFGTARLPTGTASLASDEQSVLAVLASDLIGFSSPTLGTGGGAGAGAVLAVPAGRMSVGLSLAVRSSFAYQPFEEIDTEFTPGSEVRIRAGLDGPVAQRTFLRASAMVTARGDAETGGVSSSLGNRISGTFSIEQGFGSSALTLYAFDMYRTEGGVEETAVGVGYLPKGNVFVGGVLWSFPVSSTLRLTPRIEFRDSRQATASDSDSLESLGRTTRFGVDLRQQFNPRWAGVARLEGLTGNSVGPDADVSVSGARFSAHVEFSP